tara:strand:- start:231 stop:626 length:396 start_codon:yes stop_codon:yes gene_type:complete
MILLLKTWEWCRRTLFNLVWWKKQGWLVASFFILVALYLVGRRKNSSSVIRLATKIQEVKEEEKKSIDKIKEKSEKKEKEIDFKLSADKEKVAKETEAKIIKLKARLKEDNKKVKNNSEEINNMFNDIMED